MSTIVAVKTDGAPSSNIYSQGVIISPSESLMFVSGQLPVDPSTGAMVTGDITAKTERIFENIKAILHSCGSSFDKVVRVEIFCTDLKNDFAAINAVYSRYFTGDVKPARQTVQVAALPIGSPIEISCIVMVPQPSSISNSDMRWSGQARPES